ncbi:DEAD/DEAH box helicase [Paenibacillus sp. N1-5-1-14]|uniref:DEAD/DEAH box helicase n=1 Tax=Paenibacillus radicibacter TaxID=2972488 RepID=UPI0021595656|nr:DEAD/DEAH box helicase [Paenibacillus radicibacter]MCR8644549.1 DEAD/DEAH box helicase [Paenibacillus radicibacter]
MRDKQHDSEIAFASVKRLEDGTFFIWVDEGQASNMTLLKHRLFGWHQASFYGTIIEVRELDRKQGVILPPYLAMDYLAQTAVVKAMEMEWSEELSLLRRAAAIMRSALDEGLFGPDHRQWETGVKGWKLLLTGAQKRDYMQIEHEAVHIGVAYLQDWFNQAVTELITNLPAVSRVWEQLNDAHPALRKERVAKSKCDSAEREIQQSDSNLGTVESELVIGSTQEQMPSPSPHLWEDEHDWLVSIGWKQDDVPFIMGLQLIEPDMEDDWGLRVILQDKKVADLIMECTLEKDGDSYIAHPIEGGLPAHWQPHAATKTEREIRKWLAAVPWLESRNRDGSVRTTLSEDDAWKFLDEGSIQLLEAGCSVFLPTWWERVQKLKPKLKAKVAQTVGAPTNSFFGMKQLIEFNWKLAIGDTELSEEEFRELVQRKRRFIQIRGKWVHLDPASIEQIREIIKQVEKQRGLSFQDVLELHLLEELPEDPFDPDAVHAQEQQVQMQVELNDHLREMVAKLHDHSQMPIYDAPSGLNGSLRKYQQEGLSWLMFLRQLGLGGVLADDMGLGKTIQWISYLLTMKEKEDVQAPALLICPTSVLGNWQMELEKFAPSIKVHMHYGASRAKGAAFMEAIQEADVVITSYTLSQMDEPEMCSVTWSSLCLDEAQMIKNAYTKQSAAIRQIPADHRIALTGTPIENRLTELWSIFDFVNPGYLSTLHDFRKRYVNPIEKEQDQGLIEQIQKLIQPFLLRRIKKDPKIQLDLPEKNEMKTYVSLNAEQGSLYENLIQNMLEKVDELTPMERRGLILATLTRLKQVCDHPSLLVQEDVELGEDLRSNKLARLIEMIGELRSEGGKCLIFTQFVKMGHLMQSVIERELGEKVQFLHGGVPKVKRDEMVAHFQKENVEGEESSAIFILSLKAGGTGLNLTAANHVFHIDRWWNPAVENQATDRAFRIGQRRDVQVHKFITLGTLEERIDEMIERKQGLSEQIVGSGEGWITELSTGELRELFALRKKWIDT